MPACSVKGAVSCEFPWAAATIQFASSVEKAVRIAQGSADVEPQSHPQHQKQPQHQHQKQPQ